ncbi:MAG: nicotinate-nucleotide adenylyltransferase [bacterium]
MEKKIGIFGGSFDPVHNGHMQLARAAAAELNLDRIVFLPARIPPHKNKLYAGVNQRLAMLRMAAGKKTTYRISTYELKRKKTTFTRQSVKHFKNYYKNSKIYFLIGGDSLAEMGSWAGGYGLLNTCQFVAGLRPGSTIRKKRRKNIVVLRKSMPNISATGIRKLIKKKKSIAGLVPSNVNSYIKKHKLYE